MNQNNFKHLFLLFYFLLFLCPSILSAQQSKITVTSFNRMENDITARITAPKRDQNGEICALIRIVTNEKDLMFEPDALGITARENKTGEVWVYVPRGARRISILHDKLGILRNYFYPDIIEKATVYEMVLNTSDDQNKPVAESNMQFLVVRPEPATANVYINEEPVPVENGLFNATMPKGEHTYRVEAPMYQPDAGVIKLGNTPVTKSVALKPKFGYMEIFSLPEQDADVYIDSVRVGKTPYRSDRMGIKEYKVRIEKQTYFPIDTVLNVTAGETVRPTFHMISTIKPKGPMNTLIMVQAGFGGGGQTSFGGMIGFTRTNGFYAAFKSDFNSIKTVGECDDNQKTTEGASIIYEPGRTEKSYLCITAGYMRRLAKPLYGYAGVGYGNRTFAWLEADTEDNWYKNTDHSASGVAAEIGAILRLKGFLLSAGFNTINFKQHQVTAGVGIIF